MRIYKISLLGLTIFIGFITTSFNLPVPPNIFPVKSKCIKTNMGWAINWDAKQPLLWDDFQSSKKHAIGGTIATAHCGFGFSYEERLGKITVNTFVRFYCRKSWKHKSETTPNVLIHEQKHFDICEIFGRKFYKGVLELEAHNNMSYRNINKLYRQLHNNYEDYQNKYDKETRHSILLEQQKLWNIKLEIELNALEKFADYTQFNN